MKRVTQDDLIEDYQRVASKLGKRPTLSEYNEHGSYSSTPIYKRFESFEELKEIAGFETGEKKLSDATLLNDLRRVANKVGRSPPVMVYDKHGNHNSKSLKRRFDNWNNALKAAGLDPTEHSRHWKRNKSKQFGKNYATVSVECTHCGEIVKRKPNVARDQDRFFCNSDCKGSFMSEQTGVDSRRWEGGKVTVECETCSCKIDVKAAEVDTSRFCSQECMIEWRSEYFSGKNHPRWKGGYKRYYGPNWRKQRKRALERDDFECQICSMGKQEHNQKYNCNPVIHHKIRFGDFHSYETANELDNLITLCKRCHGLVEGGQIESLDG